MDYILVTCIDDDELETLVKQCSVLCMEVFGFGGLDTDTIKLCKNYQTFTFAIDTSTNKVIGFVQHTHPSINDVMLVNLVLSSKKGYGVGKELMGAMKMFKERDIVLNYVTDDLVDYYKELGFRVMEIESLDFDIGVNMIKEKDENNKIIKEVHKD